MVGPGLVSISLARSEFAENGHHAAGAMHIFHVELRRSLRARPAQTRHPARLLVDGVGHGEIHPPSSRSGQQMQYSAGRTAHGDVEACSVFERCEVRDIARQSGRIVLLVPAAREIDDHMTCFAEQPFAVRMRRQHRTVAGCDRPSASVRQFIEFAANMLLSTNRRSDMPSGAFDRRDFLIRQLSSAATIIASIRSTERLVPFTTTLPASIGPPETNTVGMLRRIAAISMLGVILSQFEMHTSASAQCALTMYSTASAISSRLGNEYSIPLWPIAMPSSTAMVLNSFRVAACGLDLTGNKLPKILQMHMARTNCVKLLAIAMTYLPKSASFMPVARQTCHVRRPCCGRGWTFWSDRPA